MHSFGDGAISGWARSCKTSATPASKSFMERTNLVDRILRTVLVGVGLFDLMAGLVVLGAPRFLSLTLKLPLPSEMFYVWLVGMLQIVLALAYLIGAVNPARYLWNIVLAAVMRVAMAVLLIFVGVTNGFAGFTLLGVAEILIGVYHSLY